MHCLIRLLNIRWLPIEMDPKSGNAGSREVRILFGGCGNFEEIQEATGTNGRRSPSTYALEAADDIAYKTADIEDAFIKGFISYHKIIGRADRAAGNLWKKVMPIHLIPARLCWTSCI